MEIPEINIFPNPANHEFFIDSKEAVPTEVELFDITGKVVAKEGNTNRIETSALPSGIYIVRVYFGNEVQVRRVEVTH